MGAPTSQYVRRLYASVPCDRWGTSFPVAHGLNDGNGSGYTPRMAGVTQVYIVGPDNLPHPVESSVARVAAVDAKHVYLVVGAVDAGLYRKAYAERLCGDPQSALVVVETRMPVSSEIGVAAVGDDSIGLPLDIGLPLSLMDVRSST